MARAQYITVNCTCGATGASYPATWCGMWQYDRETGEMTSHNGCSECRNDIRRMQGLEPLEMPAVVLLEDRLAGRGAGSQMRLC